MSIVADRAKPDSDRLSVELLDAESLPSLRQEWKGLFESAASDNPFLSFEWAQTCCRHMPKGVEPILAVAREDGLLVGVGATEIAPVNPIGRELRFLGSIYSDYAGFLAATDRIDEVTRCILESLLGRGGFDRVALKGFRGTLDGHRAAVEFLSGVGTVEDEAIFECPVVDTGGDYESYFAGRSHNLRRKVGRVGRKLQRECQDAAFWRTDSVDRERLVRLFDMHAGRDAERVGTGVFVRKSGREFFEDLSLRFSEAGLLDAAGIDVGDQPIALAYGLRLHDTYYYWICTYDRRYGQYSPGHLLIDYLLRTGLEVGLTRFDFMVGTEPYKDTWATERHTDHLVTCRVRGHSVVHALQSSWEWTHELLRSIKDRSALLNRLWVRLVSRG